MNPRIKRLFSLCVLAFIIGIFAVSGCAQISPGSTPTQTPISTQPAPQVLPQTSTPSMDSAPVRPIKVDLSFSEAPLLGKPVEVTIVVAVIAKNAAGAKNVTAGLHNSEGFEVVSGTPFWKGDLVGNNPVEFKTTIRAIKTGTWRVIASAVAEEPAGWDGSDGIYAIVSEGNATVGDTLPRPPREVLPGEKDAPKPKPTISQSKSSGQSAGLEFVDPLTITGKLEVQISENELPPPSPPWPDPPNERGDEWKPMVWGGVYAYDTLNNSLGSVTTGTDSSAGEFSITVENPASQSRGFYIRVAPRTTIATIYDDQDPPQEYYYRLTSGGQPLTWYPTSGQGNISIGSNPHRVPETPDQLGFTGAWRIYETIAGDFFDRGAWDYLKNEGPDSPGYEMSEATVIFPTPLAGSGYIGDTRTIHIKEESATKALDVVQHEYAHFIMHTIYDAQLQIQGGGHMIEEETDQTTAWVEGWADAFPLIVQSSAPNPDQPWVYEYGNDRASQLNLESPTWGTWNDNGDAVEGHVAGALFDIYDSVDDSSGYDEFVAEFDEIWETFTRTEQGQPVVDDSFEDFWNALKTRFQDTVPPARAVFQNTIPYSEVRLELTASSTSGGDVATPGEGLFTGYLYNPQNQPSIEATPDAHYHFVNWTGTAVTAGKVANPNSASTTIDMERDYTVVANFAIDQHSLTTSSTSGGDVTVPGESTYNYDYGTVVNLV